MPTNKLCSSCEKGYLTAEYSKSEGKLNYFCNNCFKYSTKDVSTQGDTSPTWEELTNEEIEEFLASAFGQSNK